MRGFADFRLRPAAVAAVLGLVIVLGACGEDQCNHVITDVPTFEACQAIAVERHCSPEVTYSRANENSGKPARCKVERCGDCDGGLATPTVTPATPAPTPAG